jgi:hypothetical protein
MPLALIKPLFRNSTDRTSIQSQADICLRIVRVAILSGVFWVIPEVVKGLIESQIPSTD